MHMITTAHLNTYTKALDALPHASKSEAKHVERRMREANRKAQKATKEAVSMALRTDNKFLIGATLSHLARMHLLNGRFDKALSLQQEAAANLKEIDEKHELALCLVLGAEILWRQKDSEKAMNMGN